MYLPIFYHPPPPINSRPPYFIQVFSILTVHGSNHDGEERGRPDSAVQQASHLGRPSRLCSGLPQLDQDLCGANPVPLAPDLDGFDGVQGQDLNRKR